MNFSDRQIVNLSESQDLQTCDFDDECDYCKSPEKGRLCDCTMSLKELLRQIFTSVENAF